MWVGRLAPTLAVPADLGTERAGSRAESEDRNATWHQWRPAG